MQMFRTALGRLVPVHEAQTVLEDQILDLLFSFRMNPLNPGNAPMKVSEIVQAVSAPEVLVTAAIDALLEAQPPLLSSPGLASGERAFYITGTGVRFVRNMPQDLASVI